MRHKLVPVLDRSILLVGVKATRKSLLFAESMTYPPPQELSEVRCCDHRARRTQSDIEEGVLDILRVAQLTTASQIKQCFDTKMEVEARTEASCARIECQWLEALEEP